MLLERLKLKTKLTVLLAISRARARAAGSHCSGFLTHANGVYLIAATRDLGVGRHLAFSGSYDPTSLSLYRKLLTPDSRLLVVGAHIGSILFPLALCSRESVGIEANPHSFTLLEMNRAINRLENCALHNVAASDRAGSLRFLASEVNSGGSKMLPQIHSFEYFYDRPETIEVKAVRLDDHLTGKFDVVIMDIEGAEYRAMAGMERILASSRYLVVELVPNHLETVDPCSVEQFLERIPAHFKWFSLCPEVEEWLSRNEFRDLYERIKRDNYYSGVNVLCSASPEVPTGSPAR